MPGWDGPLAKVNVKETLMRLLIKLFIVFVICFVVIGLWQGWFSFSSSPNPDANDNKVNLNVSVDKAKMKSDIKRAEEKIKEKATAFKDKGKTSEAK
jgi:hypothetical protein